VLNDFTGCLVYVELCSVYRELIHYRNFYGAVYFQKVAAQILRCIYYVICIIPYDDFTRDFVNQ